MEQIAELRRLAGEPYYRSIFTFLSTRRDTDDPITIERILSGTRHKIPRNEVVLAIKALDRLNLCNFVAGRRNFPSRVLFFYTPSSIGKVALGQSDALERTTPSKLNDPQPVSGVHPFQVQTTALGTLFILPSTATVEDKEALAQYIRNMELKRSA
jgi:hypothetical protein